MYYMTLSEILQELITTTNTQNTLSGHSELIERSVLIQNGGLMQHSFKTEL